ncbi:non-hydrolyzing UDP-N-acetylglucosamine 2-epimerase [Portibacter lacus]|uniref:UDP-N-acetyl glucosamine 2-epimerase n=1 Tax=Portibacter lacus TaxID=1099794 RepID=A0AA37SU93_9BACT|nr:UDP-N-acetylglucosamine 2-epimerase (non-hydrolyzing) [Portibacter lacus]GLR18876.1 UDP-N-acetyl glucosamine 2-epimerase [Portibacter lacus]
MKKLDIIAGARPNFMKIGPITHAIHKHNESANEKIEYRLIHTGQHYDKKMSEDFFDQLNIPKPNLNLGVGSGTQAEQTGKIMLRYEEAIKAWKPQLCIVVGDVTSTMACSITAKKEGVKVAHVEGGIRSGDESMPEEINRMVTDSITDYFFTTSSVANENLKNLGHHNDKVFFAGNTMIDSLYANLERLIKPSLFDENQLKNKDYLVMTLHRPSNVDAMQSLEHLLSLINNNVDGKKVVFPMHPRTKKMYDQLGMNFENLLITGPMSYLEFIYMIKNALGVITDSGGITEETTVLGVPCMTLRNSTERPETVTQGTNEIVGTNPDNILPFLEKLLLGQWKKGSIPELWDGKTADRIVKIISGLD